MPQILTTFEKNRLNQFIKFKAIMQLLTTFPIVPTFLAKKRKNVEDDLFLARQPL